MTRNNMFRSVGNFIVYALAAVFVQNLALSGAAPFGMISMFISKPKKLPTVSVMISVFSLLTALSVLPLDYVAPIWSSPIPIRAFLLCITAIIWYLIASAIFSRLHGVDETAELLPTAAINGTVLAMPLMLDINAITDPLRVCGLAAGSGLGFALAAWLLMCGLRRADNPDIPEAFRGTPVMLVYTGLLALGFEAFGGGISLFPA